MFHKRFASMKLPLGKSAINPSTCLHRRVTLLPFGPCWPYMCVIKMNMKISLTSRYQAVRLFLLQYYGAHTKTERPIWFPIPAKSLKYNRRIFTSFPLDWTWRTAYLCSSKPNGWPKVAFNNCFHSLHKAGNCRMLLLSLKRILF